MKKETQKLIEKIAIVFAPVFTLIMYLLPWITMMKEKTVYHSVSTGEAKDFVSYIEVLKLDGVVFAKVLMYLSLIGLIVTITMYTLSFFLKEQEKFLIKIGAIILVVSTAILVLTSIEGNFKNEVLGGAIVYRWIDFMTPLYGLLLTYNVASLIYFVKTNKQDKK